MFEIGDLVGWRGSTPPLKGVVKDIIHDVDGDYLALHVLSIDHLSYARGTEVLFRLNDWKLYKRDRR